MMRSGEAIFANFFNLESGTATIPIFGSIVQNGKFSAAAFVDLVRALKRVDFPTFGSPTIPIFKFIIVFFNPEDFIVLEYFLNHEKRFFLTEQKMYSKKEMNWSARDFLEYFFFQSLP